MRLGDVPCFHRGDSSFPQERPGILFVHLHLPDRPISDEQPGLKSR